MGGQLFKAGSPVDVSKLPAHKVGQFLNQRMIRPVDPMAGQPVAQPSAS